MLDEYYTMHIKLQMGIPWQTGGYTDQPAWVLQAIRILSALYAEEDAKKQAQERTASTAMELLQTRLGG